MPFVSDEQRKAVFAKLKGGRGGGRRSPRAPRPPSQTPAGDSLFDILNIGTGGVFDFVPLPNAPAQAATPAGSATLTGGAIYDTPASNWFVNQPSQTPNFGTYNGPGIGPYNQEFSLTPQQAAFLYQQNTGIGTILYNMLTKGVDPYGQGGQLLPYGTPGTLEFYLFGKYSSVYETWQKDHKEYFGDTANTPSPGISSQFLNQKKPKKKKKGPSWIYGGGL